MNLFYLNTMVACVRITVALMLIIFSCRLFSAEISIEKDNLIISGILNNNDFQSVKIKLEKNSNINTIKFSNCLGGTVAAGYKIGGLIVEKKINTIARNQCNSSCAYAFLAGVARSFDDDYGVHVIMLHASRSVDKNFDKTNIINPALIRYIDKLSEGKMPKKLMQFIELSTDYSQGVVFQYKKGIFSKSYDVFGCDGSEKGVIEKCSNFDLHDFKEIGLLK